MTQFVFLIGIGTGLVIALGAMVLALVLRSAQRYDSNPHRAPRADLPPATARKIARARRAARADLRLAQRGDHG